MATKAQDYCDRIDKVIEKFNFNKVIEYPGLTVRSENQLRQFAEGLLCDAVVHGYAAAEGFIARYDNDRLSLVFAFVEVDESYEM